MRISITFFSLFLAVYTHPRLAFYPSYKNPSVIAIYEEAATPSKESLLATGTNNETNESVPEDAKQKAIMKEIVARPENSTTPKATSSEASEAEQQIAALKQRKTDAEQQIVAIKQIVDARDYSTTPKAATSEAEQQIVVVKQIVDPSDYSTPASQRQPDELLGSNSTTSKIEEVIILNDDVINNNESSNFTEGLPKETLQANNRSESADVTADTEAKQLDYIIITRNRENNGNRRNLPLKPTVPRRAVIIRKPVQKPENQKKLNETGNVILPPIKRTIPCTTFTIRIPDFVQNMTQSSVMEYRKIAENRTASKAELEIRLTEWAARHGDDVMKSLTTYRSSLRETHDKKVLIYTQLLAQVRQMLDEIDQLHNDLTLSSDEELHKVMELYTNKDKMVIEVTNLMIQLVRSFLGDRLPFRKMRPLGGVRTVWEEI